MQRKSKTTSTVAKSVKSFSVDNVKDWGKGSITFTLIVNGDIKIYNCRVVEGKNGDFISFPSRKGGDGKYYNIAYLPLDADEQKDIIEMVAENL